MVNHVIEGRSAQKSIPDLVRRKLVVGNWKMNGSFALNETLVSTLNNALTGNVGCDIAVCVPAPYLAQVGTLIANSSIVLGAQDVSAQIAGAYTGEVAAAMLREVGVSMVLVGHSERRQYHGETDAVVAAKAEAAIRAGLHPIVCVGETAEQRDSGQTNLVVERQLCAVLSLLGSAAEGLVVAYEPVWAIGTGRTSSPAQAQTVHAALRRQYVDHRAKFCVRSIVPMTILYGGSMNSANAPELLAQPDIDGGLIGGASLKAADFLTIIQIAGDAGIAGSTRRQSGN